MEVEDNLRRCQREILQHLNQRTLRETVGIEYGVIHACTGRVTAQILQAAIASEPRAARFLTPELEQSRNEPCDCFLSYHWWK